MSDTPNRREEDSTIRIWGPILIPIVAVAVAWGAMTSQLNTLQTTQTATVQEVRALSESRIRTEATQIELQRRVMESTVTREVISNLSVQLGRLQSDLKLYDNNMNQVWPRLRALDKNITILARALERLDPNGKPIQLEEPQKF